MWVLVVVMFWGNNATMSKVAHFDHPTFCHAAGEAWVRDIRAQGGRATYSCLEVPK